VSRYLFGRYVEEDLREISDHIARDNSPSTRRMMVRFVNAFRLLARRPELGHVREDLLQNPAIPFLAGGCVPHSPPGDENAY